MAKKQKPNDSTKLIAELSMQAETLRVNGSLELARQTDRIIARIKRRAEKVPDAEG